MAVFFTSDTHFGHRHIIGPAKRPFATTDDMDAALVANWNAAVAPGDTVYHLGDVCHHGVRSAECLAALNGTIHLIEGNHDRALLGHDASRFASVSQILDLEIYGQRIVLFHYPMREWNGAWRGAWHFFGHVHARYDRQPIGYSLDVGVDSHDLRPWSFDEIAAIFATRRNPFTDLPDGRGGGGQNAAG